MKIMKKLWIIIGMLLVSCSVMLSDIRYVEGTRERDEFVSYLKSQNIPYRVVPLENNVYEFHYRAPRIKE